MSNAQTLAQLDSVETIIRSSGEDSVKVKALIYKTKIYYKANELDSAMATAEKGIGLSLKMNSENYRDQQNLGECYRQKARIYLKRSDYKTAILSYRDYHAVSVKINDRQSVADALHGIANMNLYMSNYEAALKDYILSAKINEETGKLNWLANDYTNMGIVFMRQKSYSAAIAIQIKAAEIFRKINDEDGLSAAYKNIGVCYGETKAFDASLMYYKKAVEIELRMNDESLAGSYNNIGNCYLNKNMNEEALDYFKRSYALLQNKSDDYSLVYCYQGLGNVYTNLEQYELAHGYLLKAMEVAKRAEMTYELMDSYGMVAESYSNLKDFTNAFKYKSLQTELKDTIHNTDNRNSIVEMQTRFETEAKEKEIVLLKNEQEINNLAIEKQRIFIISAVAGLAALLIITLLIYNRNRVKQKLNDQLEKLSIVARSTDNIVIIMDAEGKVEWANESFERLNGISIEDLKRKKGETIFEISNNPSIREHFNKAVAEKRSVVYESENRNVEGELLWEQSMLTPVFNKNNVLQRMIIVDTNITQRKLDEQIIQEKNKDIIDSINYAKRIQNAILPSPEARQQLFPDSFILFKPRDIVSGDFYWYAEAEGKKIMAAVDCTGHGVPGAFMSMIGNAFLNEIVNKRGITEPGSILSELRHLVISTLKQSAGEGENKDGMDISLIVYDPKTNQLQYAGANNPLWICTEENGEKKFVTVKPDKRPIGYFQGRGLPFTNNVVEFKKGDSFYLFTDGFADQFGGPSGKKFKYKQLQEELLGMQDKTMEQQKEILDSKFELWKGNLEQVDDMLIIGLKLS